MSGKAVDLFLTYQFLKRLATPFEDWEAYKLGIIDKNGKVLRKSNTLDKPEEHEAWGYFDRLVANLKKLLAKVPGGKTKIGTYAAALLLIKENQEKRDIDEDEHYSLIEDQYYDILLTLVEDGEGGAIANNVGSGNIAGMGVGPQGEPGVKKKKPNPVIASMIRRKLANVDPKIPT